MDTKILSALLKKYVNIFVDEYSNYLDRNSLEILKDIDYDTIIHISDINNPLGYVNFNQIYLNNNMDSVFKTMKFMPNYGKCFTVLNNSSFTNYLEFACQNGYKNINFYTDLLFYMIFKLVVKNDTGLINGIINSEIIYISKKYKLKIPNLYKKEEVLVSKLFNLLDREIILNILFMDNTDAFKYLNDKRGYRYAVLFNNLNDLIDLEFNKVYKKEYIGFDGIINYAREYDSIFYGDAYDYILEFCAENEKTY